MALQKNIQSTTGLEIKNAYIKVDNYSCNKNNIVSAKLLAFVSRSASEEGKAPIEGSGEIITLETDYSDGAINTKKQIYEYAKTIDKYKDAIDV